MSALYTVAPSLFAGHGWWKVMIGDMTVAIVRGAEYAQRIVTFLNEEGCPPRGKTVEADTSRRGATTGEPDGHPAPAGADPHSRYFRDDLERQRD